MDKRLSSKTSSGTLAALNFTKTMLAASPLGIITYRADGSCVVANRAAAEMVGASEEQLHRQNFREIESWKSNGLLEAAERALATRREIEIETQFTSTFQKWVCLSFRMVPFEHENEWHLMTLFSDISEKKRAELALSESEERFRQFAENIREVFWMTNAPKTEMLYVSPAYELIWGRSCKSLYKNPLSWVEAIHPEDRERVLRSAKTRQTAGEYSEIYRITRPDGSTRWINDRAFPIRNPAGQVYRIVGTAEDITAQRSLEEQFRQAQKMEAIGLLAGGIAHDFNNLLTVINGYTDIMVDAPQIPPDMQEMLKEISGATRRAVNLTRQLLTFSRKQVAHMQRLNVNCVVAEVAKMLQRLIGENIRLRVELAPNLPTIIGDTGMIEQVLMNLCVNARDAMPSGGELSIYTELVNISERDVSKSDGSNGVHPGTFVRLRVQDTGCGITPQNLPRIFEPFFTTKETGKGTGLGLATVFGIAKQHHGWVSVKSEMGRGASFDTFFPVPAEELITAPAQRRSSQNSGGVETILVVEDEGSLRILAVHLLKKLGYSVLAASNGDEAMKIWETESENIDLLFTDLIMPGALTGRKLAKTLVERKPNLKVIYSSGYDPETAGQVLNSLSHGFLQKPYNLSKLAQTVRRALDGQ